MDYLSFLSLFKHANGMQLAAPVSVVSFVTLLCSFYLVQYFFKSYSVSSLLKKLRQSIREVKSSSPGQYRSAAANVFRGTSLEHLWQEYSETLHDQYEVNEGEQRLICSRATASSANFFSAQAIVETPLRTEFYKHLPGILTGAGIVGTFFGLMLGLSHFDTTDPAKVTANVDGLLKDVLFAFTGSFFSILASIFVTLSEKHRLRVCYDNLEKLTEAIDSLFDSGVGEEYLAELVRSSAENSVQTRLLKDSLVTDLREMLQNLVDTQVRENLKLTEALSSTYRDSGKQMADQVSASIESTLKHPLEAIAGAVNTLSGDQSGHVQTLLQDVLTAFMSKLDSTFGQQFSGLHEMMSQSVTAMQGMQQGFNQLVSDMQAASQSTNQSTASMVTQLIQDMHANQAATQIAMNEMVSNLQVAIAGIGAQGADAGARMAQQLERLFAESEARQRAMNESLQSFVDSIQSTVGKGQEETMQKVAASVDMLGEQLTSLFQQLDQGRAQMDQSSRAAQEQLHTGTRQLVSGLDDQVKQLLQTVSAQHAAVDQTLASLSSATSGAIEGLHQGADKMRVAADRFETAGNRITLTTEANSVLYKQIQGSTTDIADASRELTTLVADYRANREAARQMLTSIEGIVASTQADASVRTQFIQDLKAYSERLQNLNAEATEYLSSISDVLARGFSDFGEGVDRSLSKTLGSLDVELDKAIKRLAGGVQELGDNFDELSDVVEKAVARR